MLQHGKFYYMMSKLRKDLGLSHSDIDDSVLQGSRIYRLYKILRNYIGFTENVFNLPGTSMDKYIENMVRKKLGLSYTKLNLVSGASKYPKIIEDIIEFISSYSDGYVDAGIASTDVWVSIADGGIASTDTWDELYTAGTSL